MERDLTETRNACTPFGGLPEELLIQIAVHLIYSDTQSFDQLRDWVRVLISICHRIRGIFEATPELWVHVSLSWEAPCIDKFLFCAAAHPLRIQLDCAKLREPVTEPMLGLVYNARSLVTSCSYPEMCPPERHLPTFFASLRNLGSGMPNLHALTIRGNWWDDGTTYDWHLLHVAHPHLTSLTLTSVQVRGRLLPLPQLQSLELAFTMIQPDVLRNFLTQSRMLRIVRLTHPLLGYMPLSLEPAGLPHLIELDIGDSQDQALALSSLFPDPSAIFHFKVSDSALPAAVWSSTEGPYEPIISRFQRLQLSTVARDDSLDTASIEFTPNSQRGNDRLTATMELGSETLPLFLRCRCMLATSGHMLDRVTVLSIHCGNIGESSKHERRRLGIYFPSVEQLVLGHAQRWQNKQIIETLIVKQCRKWKYLRSIEFDYCSVYIKRFFHLLLAGQIAPSVTWRNEAACWEGWYSEDTGRFAPEARVDEIDDAEEAAERILWGDDEANQELILWDEEEGGFDEYVEEAIWGTLA
jgi:hypothetical protein